VLKIPASHHKRSCSVVAGLALFIINRKGCYYYIWRFEIATTNWVWQAASLRKTIGNHHYKLGVASRIPTKDDWKSPLQIGCGKPHPYERRLGIATTNWVWQAASLRKAIGNRHYKLGVASRISTKGDWKSPLQIGCGLTLNLLDIFFKTASSSMTILFLQPLSAFGSDVAKCKCDKKHGAFFFFYF